MCPILRDESTAKTCLASSAVQKTSSIPHEYDKVSKYSEMKAKHIIRMALRGARCVMCVGL